MEADRRDEVNLAGDEALVAPIREQLIAHLREENNDHLVDGALLNMHKERQPLHQLRSQNPLGWGAAGR
jgi:hypothetical protein